MSHAPPFPPAWQKYVDASIARLWSRVAGLLSSSGTLPVPQFVDPQDSTGFASNTNTGQTANNVPAGSGPILTTDEANRRMVGKLGASTTMQYLSEDLGSVGFNPANLDLNGHALTVVLPFITLHTGGTVATVVAITPLFPGGGRREQLSTSDIVSWTPFILNTSGLPGTSPVPTRILDTSADVGSWIMDQTDANPHIVDLSRPIDPAVASSPPFTVGDGYRIVRPGRLPVVVAPDPSDTVGGGTLVFEHAQIVHTGQQDPGVSSFSVQRLFFTQCSVTTVLYGCNLNDCYVSDGAQGTFIANIVAGAWIPNGTTDETGGQLNFLGGDTYVCGNLPFEIGETIYNSVFVSSNALGGGMQFQTIRNGNPGIELGQGGQLQAFGLLWGKGNGGVGLQIDPGGIFNINSSGGLNTPNLTGAVKDFGFLFDGTVLTVARAWNDATGAYTEAGGPATRQTTWANYALAIAGGGFGLNVHCVQALSGISTL